MMGFGLGIIEVFFRCPCMHKIELTSKDVAVGAVLVHCPFCHREIRLKEHDTRFKSRIKNDGMWLTGNLAIELDKYQYSIEYGQHFPD